MFFIDLTAASVPVVQHFEFRKSKYVASIRRSLELNEMEKRRFSVNENWFVVHISGQQQDFYLSLFLG